MTVLNTSFLLPKFLKLAMCFTTPEKILKGLKLCHANTHILLQMKILENFHFERAFK